MKTLFILRSSSFHRGPGKTIAMNNTLIRLGQRLLAGAGLLLALETPSRAATTINLSTNVTVSGVKRFGIGLGNVTYYDSGQMMKELLFANPGFEGLIYQSVVQIRATGNSATNAVENGALNGWPSGFWSGASYEFIYGAAKGRTGMVATSINPFSPGGNTNGTTYVFADSGAVPAGGDYLVLRKSFSGDDGLGNGAAFTGWRTNFTGGATITTELNDLPPDTLGRQCARLTATNVAQSATLSGQFDTWPNVTFVQLNGQYQLTFKAKGVGGNNRLSVTLRRGTGADWINATFQLTNSWQTYTTNFTATETGSALGNVSLQFATWAGNAALLDDVSLRQTDSDPTNSTPLRDPVIAALRNYHPGILRISGNWSRLGQTLDNELVPPFGRQRSGYTEYGTQQNVIEMGLHEFLTVAEFVGAEPWYTFPATFSPQEMANLMEYLGGPTNTPYGQRRADLGHPAPWTSAFSRIHLEFGNENWNSGYRGGCIADVTALGARASELFGVVKSSPYYDSARFNCVLGEQWVVPWRVRHTHDASANHDTLTVAGYMANQIDSFATTEELYGSVFAEPEWWSKANGLIYQDATNLLASSRPVPLAIYEVNLNNPAGAIAGSQAALDAFSPSLGAGLAVSDHMLTMLREAGARDQVLFSLGGYEFLNSSNKYFRGWGVTVDMGVTDRKRPQYLACQLLNQALAGDLLQTMHTGDDPTWSVTNVNRVSFTNAHYLQSFAFGEGTNRALAIFNLHRSSALAVNFAGSDVPTNSVTLKRLTSASINDNNETTLNVVITTNSLTGFDPAADLNLPPFSLSVLQWSTDNTPEPPSIAPTILTQPQSQSIAVGGSANFTVSATGTGPLTFQWWRGATSLGGATNAALTLINAQLSDAGNYFAIVTNLAGAATSSVATLTVTQAVGTGSAPAIATHPQSISQVNSFPAWFGVVAIGQSRLTYQWRRSGTNLSGATGSRYGWSAINPGLAGSYDVVVANAFGSITSAPATLVVSPNTASCSLTNLRLTPLNELGLNQHKGFPGGLYPGGLNYRPRAHDDAGRNITRTLIFPRDPTGAADSTNGRIALLSIGMSNTTQEWAVGANDGTNDFTVAFRYRATNDPSKNPRLFIVDGAQGGMDAPMWTNASGGAWTNVPTRLTAAGVSSNQVQVIWIKQAIAGQLNLGAFPAHALAFQNQLEQIIRAARSRFPNLQIVYLSSRTRSYAADNSLNPEPAAYEGGFAVKWLIEKQINGQLNFDPARGPVEAPWLAWGPYLWADGTVGRSDGLIWECADLRPDFTHPSQSGVRKVADQLLNFFKTDPTATPWFLRTNTVGQPPVCAPTASVTAGLAPLTVNFTANASDTDGTIVETRWTFDDGTFSTQPNPVKTFLVPGAHTARLTVTDNQGNTATGSVAVNVSLTFDLWRASVFDSAGLTNASISGPDADPDCDALANAAEYALGTEACLASPSGRPVATLEQQGGETHLIVTTHRNAAATDVTFVVELSDDLASWQSAGANATLLEDSASQLRWRLTAPVGNSSRRYVRVRVALP